MEDSLRHFLTFKDVFLLGRTGQMAEAKTNGRRTELVKERKVDEETPAETWTPFNKRRGMNARQNSISHEIDVSKKLDADFNFLNIHLMSQWVEQICSSGTLQQHSADRHDVAHKTNLQDDWNALNHNLNYLLQVITAQRHIHSCKTRELNLQALAQRRENNAAA